MVGIPSQFEVQPDTFYGSWAFHLDALSELTTDCDVAGPFTPGFVGEITKVYWITSGTVSTTTASVAFNVEINTTNLDGGVITLTHTANNTMGKVTAGTAVTGKNHFDKDDTITVECLAATGTAFTEGAGTMVVCYKGKSNIGEVTTAPQFQLPRDTFYGSWSFYFKDMTKIADGDIVTQFTPGFPGSIRKIYWIQGGTKIATADKLSTLNVEIGAVNLNGGTVSLTSAALATQGVVVESSAIVGAQNFDADDTISVEAASTTAFGEGSGFLVIEYVGSTRKITGKAPSQFERLRRTYHGTWVFPFTDMTKIAVADLVTQFTPGHPGTITKWYWVQGGTVATGTGATATLNLEINDVDVKQANGVDNATLTPTLASCNVMGEVTAGENIGSFNNFDSDDTISVECSARTAFTAGEGAIVVEYEGKIL